MISTKLNRIIELLLITLLFIFPFSYENLNTKWAILFAVVLGFLLLWLVFNNRLNTKKQIFLTIQMILFVIIFEFVEKVNISQLFNIQNPLGWRIPFSTILLSIATLTFAIKILMDKKLTLNIPEYFKYFFASMLFLVILMILFYPFMKFHYNISLDSNIELLNKVFKYALLVLLVSTHLSKEGTIKKINIGLASGIGVALVLNLLLNS